jgi:peptide/nickel transport system substrate-binding protein
MPTTRRSVRVISVVALFGLIAGACGDDGDEAASGTDDETEDAGGAADDGECTEDRVGGSISLGMFGDLAAFDPVSAAAAGTSGGVELAAVFDTLMRWNPETGEHDPRVAESLEPNDDFTEWTLTLRDGVTFGDGSPLTTEAVRFNVERHQDPANSSRALALSNTISEMEIRDDLTMVFTLDEPWTQFPYLLANEPGMIVNPAAIQDLGEDFGLMPTDGGVGPYEVARFSPGEEIVLEAKDDYWNGVVCIEQLRFTRIAGGEATYDAFRQGEIDMAFVREPAVIAQAREDGVAHFSEADSAGSVVLINNGVGDTHPPTEDVRLRQAIVHAIDADLFNERIHDGTGLPTSAVINEDSRYYQGLEGPETDVDRARELVEEVKAEGEWDGSIDLLCGNTPSGVESGVLIEAMLEDVGFDVTVEGVDAPQQRVIFERNYELACWGLGIREANAWVTLFNNLHSESLSNWIGYSDPQMDQALDDMKEAATPDDELAALERIQEAWNDTAPLATYEAVEQVALWRDEIKNLVFTQNWMVYFDAAYIEP